MKKHIVSIILLACLAVCFLTGCALRAPSAEQAVSVFELEYYGEDTYVKCTMTQEDSALLEEILQLEKMKQAPGPSESPVTYELTCGEARYCLTDDLSYVDAVIADTYYSYQPTEQERAVLQEIITSACTGQRAEEGIVIDGENSWFNDFSLVDNQVVITCHVCIENETGDEQTVGLLGSFDEDVKGGLLKEAELYASHADEPENTAFHLLPGSNSFEITFIGTYAGTPQKQNRLLPEIAVISKVK